MRCAAVTRVRELGAAGRGRDHEGDADQCSEPECVQQVQLAGRDDADVGQDAQPGTDGSRDAGCERQQHRDRQRGRAVPHANRAPTARRRMRHSRRYESNTTAVAIVAPSAVAHDVSVGMPISTSTTPRFTAHHQFIVHSANG